MKRLVTSKDEYLILPHSSHKDKVKGISNSQSYFYSYFFLKRKRKINHEYASTTAYSTVESGPVGKRIQKDISPHPTTLQHYDSGPEKWAPGEIQGCPSGSEGDELLHKNGYLHGHQSYPQGAYTLPTVMHAQRKQFQILFHLPKG